jgi:hypothetical protein
MDVDQTTGVIDTIKGMTSRELAVMLVLIVLSVAGAFWIENRYAKLRDTQEVIQQQQAQVIQLQTQILNVVNALTPEQRKEILERNAVQQALNNRTFVPAN